MNWKNAVAVASIGLGLHGCASEADSGPGAETSLVGTWVGSCTAQGSGSIQVSYAFTSDDASTMTHTIDEFSDGTCTEASLTTETTYSVVSGAGTTDVEGAETLDLTPTATRVTPLTQAAAEALAAGEGCADLRWTSGTATSVPMSIPECTYTPPGRTARAALFLDRQASYTIYRIDGSALSLGQITVATDGTSAAQRPTQLNLDVPYYRS